MDATIYLNDRVEDQLTYYRCAANRAKKIHISTQTAIIVLGLLVPVLANVSLPTDVGSLEPEGFNKNAVTICSLTLAVLTGIANFRKFGDLWRSYRTTEELIKHEKYLFITSSGQYVNQKESFDKFVSTIESIISMEHSKFRSLIEEAKRPATPSQIATKDS